MRRREPWFRLIELVVRPAISAWFNWNFEGTEHVPSDGSLLVAGNHVSHFDPLAHGLAMVRAGRRPRYLAKEELWRNPLLRRALSGAHQIPVERGSGSAAPLEAARQALKRGECVVVYPEATTTKNADRMPMQGKTGVARLTLECDVPIVPLAVWGTQHMLQGDEKGTGLTFGRPIWVKAGAPIDFSDFQGRQEDPAALREITDLIMAALTSLVSDLRERYPARWS